MRARALPLLLASALAAASSCGGDARPARTRSPVPARDTPGQSARERDLEVERLADDLMARARGLEPDVSARLGTIASQVGGRLAGFEHRLKTRASLLRKLRKILHDHRGWRPTDVLIDDALRYTLQVDDSPPGRHAQAIRAAFASFEAAGHEVVEVKNYWPPGDNYSGVNATLVAPGGLRWELQFHTAESFRLKSRDHHLYEELREVATSPARKRELYFQLAEPWKSVAIPQHMLDQKALHRKEEIILRPPP